MKTTFRKLLITSVLATAAVGTAFNAQAMTPEEAEVMAENFMQTAQAYVQSAVGSSGNVFVSMRGDVAILVGYVDTADIRIKAEAAALKDSSVNSVENYITNKE